MRALGEPKPAPNGAQLVAQAAFDLARSPYEQVRALRASTRAARGALRNARQVATGLTALMGIVRPTPPSSLNGPIGPHRRYSWASTTVDEIKAIRKDLGRNVQRCRPCGDNQRLSRAPAGTGRAGRPGGPLPCPCLGSPT